MKLKRVVLVATIIITGLGAVAVFFFSPRDPTNASSTSPNTATASRAPAGHMPAASSAVSDSSSALRGFPHKSAPAELPSGRVQDYLPGLLLRASGPPPSAEAAMIAFDALNACKALAT